jgi:dTDP-4-dehydrorhamnose reductase
MKIMLVGKDGMIGSSVFNRLKHHNLIAFGKKNFNLENKKQISLIIDKHKPDIFINAAAYTDVNLAEVEKSKVKRINSDSLKIIAKKLKSINSLLIHYSTDYLFDGNKNFAYNENDQTNPLQNYGLSKKIAEDNIVKINCKYIIIRTSWIYSINGNNFVKKIIKKKNDINDIKVVSNEYGTPTSSYFIAKHTEEICNKYISNKLNKNFFGIYNLSPKGITSRYKFAKFIFSYYNFNKKIIPIKLDFSQNVKIVKRPRRVYLSKKKFIKNFNTKIIDWKSDFIQNMKYLK